MRRREHAPQTRPQETANARYGFTIIELLFYVSIVSVLCALLLPAVVSSREAARRIQCLHHLKEIGVASHNHVSSYQAFPMTSSTPGRIWKGNGDPMQLAASPLATLMESLDPALYARIDFSDQWLTDLSHPLGAVNPKNQEILKLNIPYFRCPSDRYQLGANNYRANVGIGLRQMSSDQGICADSRNGRGAFVAMKAVRPSEFTDGLSNTAFFSEKVIGDFSETQMSPFRDRFSWTTNDVGCSIDDAIATCSSKAPANYAHQSYGGSNWLIGGLNATWYNHLLTPNSKIPDCSGGDLTAAGGGPGIYTARSLHVDGVNTLMADGSARFISQAIDARIWRALGSRNGNEPEESY